MKTPFSSSIHSRNSTSRASSSPRSARPALDEAALDRLAGDALTYLAADPDRFDRFFAVTGLSVNTLRQAAGTPAFVSHLVDYLAADERRLVAFAAETGRDPAAIEAVRAALAERSGET